MGFREKYDKLVKTEEGFRIFCREHLHIHFTELLCELMEKHNRTRYTMSHNTRMSESDVFEMLRGDKSPTLKEVSDLFAVMGYRCEITAEKLED